MTAEVMRVAQLILGPWAAIEWLRTLKNRRLMDPVGWSLATFAILCWVSGDLGRLSPMFVGEAVKQTNVTSQLLFAIWGVLCAIVGWRLAARQSQTPKTRFWLDSGMITSALMVVGWPTLLAPVLRGDADPLTKGVVITHGFADLLMIASLLLLCSRLPSLRSGPMLYVTLGQSAIAVADIIYLLTAVHGPRAGAVLVAEIGWTVGIGFLGANARQLRRELLLGQKPLPRPASGRPVGRVGLTLPYLPLVAVLAFCGVRATRHTPWAPAETWLSIVAVLVVMSRQLLVLYDNRRLLVAVSEREQRLRHHAFHDPLTGLANRLLFGEQLASATESLDADTELAVLFCDLDDFKRVNDHLGHAAGDRLLKVAAQRLTDCAPPDALVARLGGDEFALVLTGSRVAPELVAADIMARFAEPVDLDGDPLQVVVSIGITRTDGQACTAEDLLSQADLAMLSAKSQGKGRYASFDPAMKPADLRDRRLVNDFAAALRAGELYAVYQPIVELPSGRVAGLEALARWDHPQRGPVPPDRFVPLAEATGLIGALTDHMLQLVAADHVKWRNAGVDIPFVSVNISPTELLRHDFAIAVASAVDAGIPADRLILELTEGHAVPRGAALEGLLHELHATGVRLALDDFGAGHHVLANLQRLPIDLLKIDRSIVVAAAQSSRDDALLGIYVDIGRALGVPVVAEGVETDEQAARLTELGCPLAQGYLFSRPIQPADVPARLAGPHPAPGLPGPRDAEAPAGSARQ